ncbi:hypothetical protein B6A14_09130 [Polynucleobacter hirudinilacicola]|uniref:LapA adhesin domain-containing protein n=1 Tax=Polynucleobacter hirudinilacicola TaxID=1743166 RepID=A0A210RY42_9BURK|nr:Ig-like domain-containing protein [Polynucleobacter hirudinilacicola]OWF65909.1 hypothetical protein B6A14_09130 [Polynucleobacter hirudinilacicola]
MSSNNKSSSKVVTPVASPVASISGGAQTVKEGGVLSFNINIAKASSTDTKVYFKLSGSEEGYKLPSNVIAEKDGNGAPTGLYYVVIPKGKTSSEVSIKLKDDNLFDGADTFNVELAANKGVGINSEKSGFATTIQDNDAPPKISLDVSKSVEEGGTLTYTVKLDRAASEATVVNYTLNGEPNQLTIAAGDTSATFTFKSEPNEVFNGTQKVVATINSATIGRLSLTGLQKDPDQGKGDDKYSDNDHSGKGNGLVAIGKVLDNGDKPVVTIKNAADVQEGGKLVYTVELSKESSQDTVIKYVLGGTATVADADYDAPTYEIIIPKGETSGYIEITTNEDSKVEGDQTVTVTLTSAVTNGVQLIDGDDHEEDDHEDSEYSYSAESKDGDDHEGDDHEEDGENCSSDDDHDVSGPSATGTIIDKVANSAPVAVDDTYTVDEDQTVTLTPLDLDTDLDRDTLSVTSINGTTLTGNAQEIAVTDGKVNISAAGVITFTPNANFNGEVSFDYEISDGEGGTDTATETITVNAVNDNPVAVDDSIEYRRTDSNRAFCKYDVGY